jgi:hypothetical protein
MFGAFVGALAGLAYLATARIVGGSIWRRGLAFGSLALLALGGLLYSSPFKDEAAGLGQLPLTIALFAPLLVLFGLAVAIIYRALDRRLLAGQGGRVASGLGAGLLLLPAVYVSAMLALMALLASGRLSLD